jgi:Carboxypeptidase regulatory-like domain
MKSVARLFPAAQVLRGLFALVLWCSFPALVAAQDVASITGSITDPTGAVVPGVKVTLQNPQTGATYETTSNDAGSYTLNQIKAGPGYRIEFTREGFKAAVVSGLYLNVNATRTQNVQLSLGETRETVEVSAATENVTLDTTDAMIGNNVQVQFLNDLPVQDRSNPSALFVQQPGVTLDGAVTGARVDQNRVTVDGLDVNDMATGTFGRIIARAPVDSVQEFRGVTAGDLSSTAGGGGGQYELVTRSGTNSFHGALVEYHRDTALEANDWFNNAAIPKVPRPPLIRNQFGGNIGGPIINNKLFFFFDYNARRDTLTIVENRTVPMDSFRNGTLNYVNTSGDIASLTSAQVAAFDPQNVGFNSSLLSLFASRYKPANNFSVGDGINTGGYRFNAAAPLSESDYVQRVDYTLNDRMKLFARGSVTRQNSTYSAIWFPGDPKTSPYLDNSYAWVVGHTWSISNTMVNNAAYGVTYADVSFPITYNPTGATQYGTFGGNGSGGSILDGPYRSAINAQSRTYPIPVIRDDFSWQKGKHSLQFGGTFKWPRPSSNTILNYNSPTIGLGGNTPQLDPSFRPADIDPGSIGLYDPAFALALAPYTAISSTFNYNAQGTPFPQGSGQTRTYRYYETELYFGDTWKMTPKLTVSYGLRWSNYSVPYEVHGIQSVQNTNFNTYFADRVAQSAAGLSGNLAVPFISYSLGGKANHAPGYFQPSHKDFGPRLAFAYSMNPKTVVNAGAGILFDQTIINAVQYQQSQYDYLFQASVTTPFGTAGDPRGSLTTDARFTGLNSPPPTPTAPTITKPFLPFVDSSGNPNGLANGLAFNEILDPKLKTPYSIQLNFGFERELPGGFILKASYVGRLGRRLLAQADANQLIDFPDKVSGQMMSTAFANVTRQLRAGVDPFSVTPQPWYENQIPAGYGPFLGSIFGVPITNNTEIVSALVSTLAQRGDFADTTQVLAALNAIAPNVGMGSQFSENTYYTNQGFSNYHGLLATLHKNAGHGLQFDLNYTWSHSIDNVSVVANTPAIGGYGFICDVLRPRECRGNSDFDVTHYFNGEFLYDLPFGRGKSFGGTAPRWLDEIIGGWSVSGLPSVHSGNAYFIAANAFVAGYANNAPAILVGPISDMNIHLKRNVGSHHRLYAFANPSQAQADYTGPVGFDIGSRNNLRGPRYFDLDMGLAKRLPLYSDRVALKFRADAFNVLNHPNFSTPCTDLTNSTCRFGSISSMEGTTINNDGPAARVLQLSLRLEF